jgi:hypothetical protein
VPSTWLTTALATRDVERVTPNMADAGERTNDARRRVQSARQLATTDPTLAISACHDAVRKSVTGHMAAVGLRPRSGEGAHRIVLDYAREELGDFIGSDDLDEADHCAEIEELCSTAASQFGRSAPNTSKVPRMWRSA